ncbi:shu, partial [Drosophila busckii]
FRELIVAGAHFEVHTANNDYAVEYDDGMDEESENGVDHEALISPWTRSFDELRQFMTPISEHIYKRIMRAGIKEQGLVPDKARVALRYSAYWEGEEAPFDSSLLRGSNFEFETGKGNVLEGLDAAVRSMQVYEQAEFIISYHLLFHELGCPPRIKPKADALFKVEVISFTPVGDGNSLEDIAPEDRNKFAIVYPRAQDMHLHGKDCAKRGSYRPAVNAFERAIDSLNYCRMADEKDEAKQTQLLITLYTNLMFCFNKLNQAGKACIMMKAVRRLTNNKPSCKALFQEGRALAALGDYEHARKVFVQAQAKQPNNKEISAEIINIEQRVSKYKKEMREIWQRAMSVKQEEPQSKQNTDIEDHQYKHKFEAQLETFGKSNAQTINISRTILSDKEFETLRLLATKQNMKLSLSPLDVDQLMLSKLKIK